MVQVFQKVKKIMALIIFISMNNVYAVNVSGTISSNDTWSASNSPYMVVGDIEIDSGFTLQLMPGTEVIFTGKYAIKVNGKLNVNGSVNSPVVFQGDSISPSQRVLWEGIQTTNRTAKVSLHFARVSHAVKALDYSQIDYLSFRPYPQFDIKNCLFSNNLTATVGTDGFSDGLIERTEFINNGIAVDGLPGKTRDFGSRFYGNGIKIKSCKFIENGLGLVHVQNVENSKFVKNDTAIQGAEYGTIENCWFEENHLAIRTHSTFIQNSTFKNNTNGIYLYGIQPLMQTPLHAQIKGNQFIGNEIGLESDTGTYIESVTCNKFMFNHIGIKTPSVLDDFRDRYVFEENSLMYNDTSMLILGKNPQSISNQAVRPKLYRNYFDSSNFSIVNESIDSFSYFTNFLGFTIQDAEASLIDGSDSIGRGKINYSLAQSVGKDTCNIYWINFGNQIKHRGFSPSDTLIYTAMISTCCAKGAHLSIKKGEELAKRKWTLYPNPVGNQLNLQVDDANYQIQSLLVFGLSGQRFELPFEINPNGIKVNTENLDSGIYILIVQSRDGSVNIKFQK